MTPTVQLFLAVGLLIGVAKAMGYITYRLNQPAVLGELLAGLLLGPTVLDLLGNVALFPDGEHVANVIIEIGELGVLMLMFMAGMEVDPSALREVGKSAVYAGAIGVVVPLVVMTPAVHLFGIPFENALFIGILFASMSTSISAQVMLELGVLRSREGITLLTAALVDDALVILLLSLFLAINPGGVIAVIEAKSIPEVLIRIAGFLIVGTAFSWFVLPRLLNLISQLRISEAALTFALIATLLMSVAAEGIGGIAGITGAFLVGMSLRRARHRAVEEIERGLHALNYAFLVPLFFISIGLRANLRLLTADLIPFALVVTALAIVTKVLGAGLGTKLAGFNNNAALRVGLGMISRGEIGLIIAGIGIGYGILTPEVFTVVIFVVLVTTIITPPLLRWSFAQSKREGPTTDVNEPAVVEGR